MNSKVMTVVLFVCAALMSSASLGRDVEKCTSMTSSVARLECYDALFLDRPLLDAVQAAEFGKEQMGESNLLSGERAAATHISARVESVGRGLHNEMKFTLDNLQVWRQVSPKTLTIRQGDQVKIRRGVLGSYVLTTERGASTRVRREQ